MTISEIKIRKIYTDGKLRALVSITIDNSLAVHDIKVISANERSFIAMPSRRETDGTFRDIVHPISADIRHELETKILEEYENALNNSENYNIINNNSNGLTAKSNNDNPHIDTLGENL